MEPTANTQIIAYEIHDSTDMPLCPAPTTRPWMDDPSLRFAYRCLPIVIANQAGWVIASPCKISARWNGGPDPSDLRLRFPGSPDENRIKSHFGHGILTFTLPYLFRTPPGINLWVKGPSNSFKDGIHPLEGIVEADWSVSTFTMNWKLTRSNRTIRFDQGEPICMIVPIPRNLLESLEPTITSIQTEPQLSAQFQTWSERRSRFSADLDQHDPAAVRRGWERHYMLGLDSNGRQFDAHQTKLHVRDFTRRPGPES
jgi:hypothetical protein